MFLLHTQDDVVSDAGMRSSKFLNFCLFFERNKIKKNDRLGWRQARRLLIEGWFDLIRLSQRALFDSIELSLLLPSKTAFALRVYWTDIEWNEIFFCLSFVRTSRRWLQSVSPWEILRLQL